MLRQYSLLVGLTVLAFAAVRGQTPQNPNSIGDLTKICADYGQAQLVFVGRAQEPVAFRISGEAEIEKARETFDWINAEVARQWTSLDFRTRFERAAEFELKLIEARAQFEAARAWYPPPFDLTVIPVDIEKTFRGSTSSRILLRQTDSLKLEPGTSYLLTGQRDRYLRPAFPGKTDLVEIEYVNVTHATNVASAQEALRFLSAMMSESIIFGTVRMHSYGELRGDPLGAVRVIVSSETRVVETMTGDDGSYVISGVPAGRIQVRPILSPDLTVVNKPVSMFDVREHGCKDISFAVAPNGRVRGRIVSATGDSLEAVQLTLQGFDPQIGFHSSTGHMIFTSHVPRLSTRPNDHGTFEFSGVFPGWYLLSARLEKTTDGKKRYLTTYFPGTPNLASAQPVVVGQATLHDGFDFLVATE